ncbi:hypothetical protein VKT23_006636 [Stygiomarasmius scandens]|uniref:Novel STAND NTPase 1 domain-containing protein n=1 Tax=Marasmiellus scandens TaxID=2682957 RepID=A0ABR1JNC9_9AGAR
MVTDVTLVTLQVVASAIPFPPASGAVKAAIHLIEMCQNARTASEQINELRERVKALSLVMVQGLSGKPMEQIPDPVRDDVEQLQKELNVIEPALKKISERNRLVNILFKNTNDKAMNKCLRRLNGALGNFEFSRQIKDAMVLERLQYEVHLTYTMLRDMHTNMEGMKRDLSEVRKLVQDFHTDFRQESKPASRRSRFPPVSSVFYGREELVERLATKLTTPPQGTEQALVTLLGPGGMGKTSVGLAVMEHRSVIERFKGNRFWVPCESAESASLLLDALYESLGINKQSGKPLDDILDELEPPSGHLDLQPARVLLLDNFETPWNLGRQERKEVENILRSVMRIPRVSILITMRANQSPTEGWEEERITPLNPEASIKIYKSIHPKGKTHRLPELLASIGHFPLAVTLVAKYAQTNNATPTDLLEAWDREGIVSLDGQDNRISTSIKLSVDSPPMKQNPDSLKLLVLLAFFPGGVPTVYLRDWLPPSIDRLKALSVLSTTALVEQRDGLVMVIPVIRSYVLHSGHTPQKNLEEAREHVRLLCCSLLAQHKSLPGDPPYLTDKAFISSQEANFQSILLDATSGPLDVDANPSVLEALLTLCWHQIWTRPRIELIQHTLSLSERSRNERYIAESLACYGEMCIVMTQLKDAIRYLTLAHDKFINLNDKSAAAVCSIRLLESRMHHEPSFEDDLALVHRAKSEYGTDNPFGEALCFLYEGKVYWQKGDRELDALDALEQAKGRLEHLGKHFELAHCLYFLSRTYHRSRNFESRFPPDFDYLSTALHYAQQASDLYIQCGYGEYIGRGLVHLANVLEDQQSYKGAFWRAYQALDIWHSSGSAIGVAQALQRCGSILLAMGEYVPAHELLKKALVIYDEDEHTGYAKRIYKARCENSLDLVRRKLKET